MDGNATNKLKQEDYSHTEVLKSIVENHPTDEENKYQKLFTEQMTGFNPDKLLKLVPNNPREDKGLRHNKGKIRYDLLEPFAITELAKVFTKGAEKYADRNWEKGMKWSKMRASLGRHLAAY